MTSTQSNTQSGLVKKLVSTATLVDKEGYLAKLVNGDTDATVELAGAGECALFVITEGAAVGAYAELLPLSSDRNVRVIAGATIAGGTKVAASATGKLAAATAGDHVIGVLENDVVNGQLGLVRPVLLGFHQAATAYTPTATTLAGTLTGTADGTIADIAASAGACAGGATPTAAEVDTAIATAVATIVTGTNTQLKELQAKVNALIVDVAALETILNANKITS